MPTSCTQGYKKEEMPRLHPFWCSGLHAKKFARVTAKKNDFMGDISFSSWVNNKHSD